MSPPSSPSRRVRPLTWSPVTESNRRPSPYHGDALPTELTGPVSTADGDELTVLLASRCLLHGWMAAPAHDRSARSRDGAGNRTPSAIRGCPACDLGYLGPTLR